MQPVQGFDEILLDSLPVKSLCRAGNSRGQISAETEPNWTRVCAAAVRRLVEGVYCIIRCNSFVYGL